MRSGDVFLYLVFSPVGNDVHMFKAPCKRTQHCWPTTPNIVGCYMLRPFVHPVASYNIACCWELLRNV